MLRLDYPNYGQKSAFEIWLPEGSLTLTKELIKADELLRDECFEEPFLKRHMVTIGRGSVPIRPYIRLMFLKERNQWGYETLVEEVTHNFMYKAFCRIPCDEPVPDSTTLIKLNHKYGDEIIRELNALLISKLSKKNVIRGNRLRVDTTVIESNIHFPTDIGLLSDCVKNLNRVVRKIRKTDQESTTSYRSKTRTVKHKVLSIGKVLRRRSNETIKEVREITKEVVQAAKEASNGARLVLKKVRQTNQSESKLVQELEKGIQITDRIISQSEQVVAGNISIPERIVSIFDPEARPIKKGKLGKKAEFGYKLQIEESDNGFITGYEAYTGNPADDELLLPAVNRHIQLFGKAPRSIAADRGYGSKSNEDALTDLRVKNISIPRRGKKSKSRLEVEHCSTFKRYQKWRVGIEGTISLLKRRYGLSKTRVRGFSALKTEVGWGIFTLNLRRASR